MLRPDPHRGNRILVVDDDVVLCEIAESSLAAGGYLVERAGNGIEALYKLSQDPFDLIVTDLNMPEMGGIGLLEAVRVNCATSHLPMIVMTSQDDFASIERAYGAGATSFIAKPVNWSLFSHHVRYILRASRQEAELREAKDVAEAASQSKSNLLAVVTHEFRTPLHQIIGFLDLMLKADDAGPGAPKRDEYSARVRDAAMGLNRIVSDMVLLARLLSRDFALDAEDHAIASLISRSIALVRVRAERRGIDIVEQIDHAPDVDVNCDQALMHRALGHILENAVEHSPEEGTIVVGSNFARNGSLIVFVQDEGAGLSPGQIDGLLQPFTQVDMSKTRPGSGMGIGLALARLAVEAHGGRIVIRSSSGAGTTAAMVFPAERVRDVERPELQAERA